MAGIFFSMCDRLTAYFALKPLSKPFLIALCRLITCFKGHRLQTAELCRV